MIKPEQENNAIEIMMVIVVKECAGRKLVIETLERSLQQKKGVYKV